MFDENYGTKKLTHKEIVNFSWSVRLHILLLSLEEKEFVSQMWYEHRFKADQLQLFVLYFV